ncbi:menaquinone-dependent protoporphyrinogen IX dehydrogenase [Plebeiibacterium marinum]|uniref:Protoporphyrinogen IX dehydrogenase [quinone] n=1 Tax=Plebeiibacterium marinum TaxID=2992111 RepID=A0AAE3MGZ3_9BACT|nr:menaquinone-dependent protoporphyrinogen IX dehydrogenase [Plebeiobacterium marinum]MCW3807316.1 menaquinone-dependent protoporphyrinogen IX dehydrogenase [Plebeiobacterium marinum]
MLKLKSVCILYSSTDGQTLKICNYIAENISNKGIETCIQDINSFSSNVIAFDTIVIGASIRYGHHRKIVFRFIDKYRHALEKINTGFFSVNLVARKKAKNTPDTNPYVINFLDKMRWEPKVKSVFAGRLDYGSYSILDKLIIKLIMKLTNGPVKSDTPIEYTSWDKVDEFIENICKNL